MTEDKADKALRKVYINLIPSGYRDDVVLPENASTKIDISDKLNDKEYYIFNGITVERDGHKTVLSYVSYDQYIQFRNSVRNIIEASLVNSSQKDAVNKLIDEAFYQNSHPSEL